MFRRITLLLALVTTTFFTIQAQTVTGGAGVTLVNDDPDDITAMQGVSAYESNLAYDPTNQIMYFYDPSGTAGVDQWSAVSVASFTNSDTRLGNPTVSGGNLQFDIIDVVTGSSTGATVTIPVLSIAPVQSVVGGGDISVSDNGSGVYTVSFTENLTTLTIDGSTLTYTDEDGAETDISLPQADGSETKVTAGGDIAVTGTGTTADPYIVSFTENLTTLTLTDSSLVYVDEDGETTTLDLSTNMHAPVTVNDGNTVDFTASGTNNQTITAEITGSGSADEGQIPMSDGAGNITWSDATITSIAVNENGRLVATLSSGTEVFFDLDDAPRVDNMGDLETAATALGSGETGIAVSNDGNNFGMPSKETASVEIGVLFFIKKK